MFEVITYHFAKAKNSTGFRIVGKKVVATFDDLAAAREFVAEKPCHAVQYSQEALRARTA